MSKKTRMPFATCQGCGKSLKKKQRRCPRCGRVNRAATMKAAGGSPVRFIGKSSGSAWPCPGCGHRLGKNATSCSRCGRAGGPGALKSTGQSLRFLGKSAGPAAGPRCGSCFQVQRPGNRCCTGCGQLMPGAQPMVVKSAEGARWSDEFWRESDPGRRELLYRLMHPESNDQRGGGAA